jgi:hypothetical protein
MEELRDHMGVLGVDGCIILQQIIDIESVRTWNEFI